MMNPALERLLAKVRFADLPQFMDVPLDSAFARGREPFRETLLHVVAIWGDTESAQALLDAGVEIDVPGELGCTALHEAARQGHVDVVRLLLAHGANPRIRSEFGDFWEIAEQRDSLELQKLAAELRKEQPTA